MKKRSKKKTKVIIACGGTGGHIAPGIGLGEHIREKCPELHIIFMLGDKKIARDFEGKIPPSCECIFLPEIHFRKISSFFSNLKAVLKIIRIIFSINLTDVKYFFSTGSGSGVIPAVLLRLYRCPVYLLEQNSVMGKANKVLSFFAEKIFLTLPLKRSISEKKEFISGSPLPSYACRIIEDKSSIYREFSLKENLPVILIMGGSQGARSLNYKVLEILRELNNGSDEFQVVHLTGRFSESEILNAYKDFDIEYRIKGHYQEMYRLYNIADVAISRAGAGSLSELSYWGIPALLLPYPHAAEDHQYYNGKYFEENGEAYLSREDSLVVDDVVGWLKDSLFSEEIRDKRKKAMKNCLSQEAGSIILYELKI